MPGLMFVHRTACTAPTLYCILSRVYFLEPCQGKVYISVIKYSI